MPEFKHVIVASHPRSGTHLTIDSLRLNFDALEDDFINLDRLLPTHKKPVPESVLVEELNSCGKIPIIKTHSTAAQKEFGYDQGVADVVQSVMDNSKIVYVYRDGRDTLTSLYHFYQNRVTPAPPKIPFAEFLRTPTAIIDLSPAACGWPTGMTPAHVWARHVDEWVSRSNTFAVGYEEWSREPTAVLGRIATFLGLPAPASMRRATFQRPSLLARLIRKITGKQLASSAVMPRKGVVGDWVNSFSKEDEAFFWDIAGATMQRLGYTR